MLNGRHRSKNHIGRAVLPGISSRGSFVQGTRAGLWEKDAPAQGMLEFALVLPILLLIIFGIIAFGHFFFSYSLVVAASRDAARFGAAVGITDNSVPRYRDCKMIRGMAVNSGRFAGVDGTDATVKISYDKGPKLDGSTEEYVGVGCPEGGVGPGNLELGDRIVVTVSTLYQPIVPLVPIPTMTLTATSRRTIMLAMPVGNLPIAEQSKCVGTLTRIIVPDGWFDDTFVATDGSYLGGSFSYVGKPITFDYEVIADEIGETAQGKLHFYVDDSAYATPADTDTAPSGSFMESWNTVTPQDTPHILRARYDNTGYTTTTPCYDASKAEPIRHHVLPAETITEITVHDPDPSQVGEPVEVTVEVRADPEKGGGTPLGTVEVTDSEGNSCIITLVDLGTGIARGSCTDDNALVMDTPGMHTIHAVYDPDNENENYNTSDAEVDHEVEGTETNPIETCPVFSTPLDLTTNGSSMIANLENTNFINFPITGVTVTANPTPADISLMLVKIDDALVSSDNLNLPLSPAAAPVSYNLLADTDGTLRVDFSHELPMGTTYSLTVTFGLSNPPVKCNQITIFGAK